MSEFRKSDTAFLGKLIDHSISLVIAIISGLLIAWLSGQPLPGVQQAWKLLSVSVPLWCLTVPVLCLLFLDVYRKVTSPPLSGDLASHKESLKFMEELLDGIRKHSRERLLQLQDEAQANRQALVLTKENLAKLQQENEQLRLFSTLSEQFFTSTLDNFYPLVLEASERTEEAYLRCFRGKREALRQEFARTFDAGRNFGPVPQRKREHLVFYLGVTGQLDLDVAYMAELSTRLPLKMLSEAKRQPELDVGKIFDVCYESLKATLSSELPAKWSSTPAWASDVLDHFIRQATEEAKSQP